MAGGIVRRRDLHWVSCSSRSPSSPDGAPSEESLPLFIMKVLYETPSGFAIFSTDSRILDEPKASDNLWTRFSTEERASYIIFLMDFQRFEDKSLAIHPGGIDKRLAEMLLKWLAPDELLAVGKQEYKNVIEELGINCRCDENVMELMWGLKMQRDYLVPEEKAERSEDEHKLISRGLQKFLAGYEFEFEPAQVNKEVLKTASFLRQCDDFDARHRLSLEPINDYLAEKSGLSFKDWDILKHVNAVMYMCTNDERYAIHLPPSMFSEDEMKKIKNAKADHSDVIIACAIQIIYEEAWRNYNVKGFKFPRMFRLERAAKAHQKTLDNCENVQDEPEGSKKRKYQDDKEAPEDTEKVADKSLKGQEECFAD